MMVLKIIEKQDERIILIASLNEGLDKARMDADDISLFNRFEKQIEYMENNNLDICGCHYYKITIILIQK